jgi:DNA processing protein
VTDDRALGFSALLAGHPAVGPRRLRELLLERSPEAAWRAVGGDPGADPVAVATAHRDAGVAILREADPGYPGPLRGDPEPPAVLFARGDLSVLDRPRVAVVGTRRCTGGGAGFARELGRDLTEAGVAIVSGLALGIDGASHRGVLDACGRPIGVVGSGLDVVYPSRHHELWSRVGTDGLLLSEAALGVRPAAWRFPARNRVIAGLAAATVVVEARERSGALITADLALEEGREVFSVPGEITSALSAGTNALLRIGATALTSSADVLEAFGISPIAEQPVELSPPAELVLSRLRDRPASADELVRGLAVPAAEVATALAELELASLVDEQAGVYRAGRV